MYGNRRKHMETQGNLRKYKKTKGNAGKYQEINRSTRKYQEIQEILEEVSTFFIKQHFHGSKLPQKSA